MIIEHLLQAEIFLVMCSAIKIFSDMMEDGIRNSFFRANQRRKINWGEHYIRYFMFKRPLKLFTMLTTFGCKPLNLLLKILLKSSPNNIWHVFPTQKERNIIHFNSLIIGKMVYQNKRWDRIVHFNLVFYCIHVCVLVILPLKISDFCQK